MTNFFITDANGKKHSFTEQQLQALAVQGKILPTTSLETDTGHKGLAGQIPGLKFPSATPQSVSVPVAVKNESIPKPVIIAGTVVIASFLLLLLAVVVSNSGSGRSSGGGNRPPDGGNRVSGGGGSRNDAQLDQLRRERDEVRRTRNEAEDWLRRVAKHNELVAKIDRRGGMAEIEFSSEKDQELWKTPVGTIQNKTKQAEQNKIQADRRLEELESKIRDLENAR
jgi:hypothetical protein